MHLAQMDKYAIPDDGYFMFDYMRTMCSRVWWLMATKHILYLSFRMHLIYKSDRERKRKRG